MTTLIRGAIVFLILALTLGTNLEDSIIARLGLNANYGYVIGAALIGTALIAGRNTFIIAAIILICLNANMPADFVLNLGLDRDYYAGLLIAVVFLPLFEWVMD